MRHDKHGVRLRPVPGDATQIGVYDIDDTFVCLATNVRYIPTEIKMAYSGLNDGMLHLGETLLAKAHATVTSHTQTDAEDDTDDEVRNVILGDAIANLLDTTPQRVHRKLLDPAIDGHKTVLNGFFIDDPEVSIDGHDAADLLVTWADAEATDIYRIDTPSQSLTWDTSRPTARLADKNTGEITFISVVHNQST